MKKIFVYILISLTTILNIDTINAAQTISCPKNKLNQISNNKICLKENGSYKWLPIVNKISNTNSDNLLNKFSIVNQKNTYNIYKIADNNIDNYSNNYKTQIDFVLSPHVNISRIDEQSKILNKSINVWSSLYKPNVVTPWIFTYEDKGWLLNNIKRKDILNNVSNHYFNDPNNCSYAGVWNSLENNSWVSKNEMYICMDKGSEDLFFKHHTGHEYTHIVQGYSVNRSSSSTDYPIVCWAFEGMPTFYGISIGDVPDTSRDNFYKNSISSDFKNIIKSKNLIKKFFIDNSSSIPNCPGKSQDIYVAGSLATELLVAANGHDSILQFYKNLNILQNWDQAFLKTFNLTTDNFYDIVSTYIYNYYIGL